MNLFEFVQLYEANIEKDKFKSSRIFDDKYSDFMNKEIDKDINIDYIDDTDNMFNSTDKDLFCIAASCGDCTKCPLAAYDSETIEYNPSKYCITKMDTCNIHEENLINFTELVKKKIKSTKKSFGIKVI